jgi:hypothetical protein
VQKNKDGEYHCPVTFKLFGPHAHIGEGRARVALAVTVCVRSGGRNGVRPACAVARAVAIRPTGNVFSYEAVEELCFKSKNYKVGAVCLRVTTTSAVPAIC